MRKLAAEAIGTFALVFAGTGAIIVNDISQGTITHGGIAVTFGLAVMVVIYSVGDVSGAHINPAVTISFWGAGRFSGRAVLPYVIAQCLGGILASGLLRALFPTSPTLGATLPSGPWLQSFVLEGVLTLFLMFVILNVSIGGQEKGIMAGAAVGAVVTLEAMFAGPICGASMNPVRSLAPAIVSGQFNSLWIYIIAPLCGALAAVPLNRCVRGE